MNKLELVIQEIQGEVENYIVEVNAGGCGIFALYMHTELAKIGIDSEMVVIMPKSTYKGMPEIMEYKLNVIEEYKNNGCVENGFESDASFSHCCIQLKYEGQWMNFDAEGFQAIEDWDMAGYLPVGEYTAEEMKIALEIGGWNSDYDRRQNGRLSRIIKDELQFLTVS